jgi:peptide/nickel transport system substrate-binding protein
MKRLVAIGSILVLALAAAGCGGSAKKSRRQTHASRTVTVLLGKPPDSLDPQSGSVTQSAEADWIVYTGLTTYAHSSGSDGGQLVPGLATTLPLVSPDGKTYTTTLRRGLVYSNGQPVKASDFLWTVQRAIRLPWAGAGQFLIPQIVGARAFADGKAKTISGITANDATLKITIHLTAPYGPFENVLAFPALGFVPSGTPVRDLREDPPPGVGPYVITRVVPDTSFSLVRNPRWSSLSMLTIPAGHVDIEAKVSPNLESNALAVLHNTADVFDWADVIPLRLLGEIQSRASGRYSRIGLNSTYYFFLNTQSKPFSSQLARQAVVTGLDRGSLNQLSSGILIAACFYLPPGMPGHPNGSCPYGNPVAPDLTKAKALLNQSGMAGSQVTVWGEVDSPHKSWVDYYTSYLNQIGFKATEKLVPSGSYFTTIGNLKLGAQTGFDDWNQDFPNPIDFYAQLQSASIRPTSNQNHSQVKDPHIDVELAKLEARPTSDLPAVAREWQLLDAYTAQKAYLAVFGYPTFPAFTSSRINYRALVFSPVYGWDWTSFELN